MRTLVTIAALFWVVYSVIGQIDPSRESTQKVFDRRLAVTDPSDTSLIKKHISEALKQVTDSQQRADLLLIAGTYLVENYQYNWADTLLDQCLRLTRDSMTLAKAKYMIGTSFMYRDIRLRSLTYFHNSLDIYTRLGDSLGMGRSLDRIADNHNYIGEHETARPYYDRCIEIFSAINDTAHLTNVLGNIGGMYSEDGYHDSAIIYYQQAIELNKQTNALSNLSSDLSGMAIAMEGLGRSDKALRYYQQSYHTALASGDEIAIAFANQHLGYYFFNTGQMDSAKYYMEIANDYATKTSNAQLLINTLDILHQVAYIQKNYSSAYRIFSKVKMLQDSLLRLENVSLIASLRKDYEMQQKDLENAALVEQADLREKVIRNQSRLNTTLIISAILLIMAIIAMLLLNRSRREKNRLIKKDRDLIRQQAEQLKELNEFKSAFFANISHDIRTPITMIKGFADLIKQFEPNLSDESKEYLEYIDENVNRLKSMTDEISQLIQLEENRYQLHYTSINITRFFGTLANMFTSGKANEHIQFDYQTDIDQNQTMLADKAALEKIIFNLVDNAFKYNTTGTNVRMEVKVKNKQVIIKVTDDGPGIEPEKLNKIFTRYYRTSTSPDAPHGQGIGLSLVKDLIELHGGRITVTSVPGQETCFEVVLPLNPGSTE